MIISKKLLEKEYIQNKKSTIEIGKKYKIGKSSVYNYLLKYKIKPRTRHQSMYVKYKKTFPDLENIKEENWKGLAWVLDTEGSIGFQSYKTYLPSISIGMCSKKFIENMIKEFPNIWKRWAKWCKN